MTNVEIIEELKEIDISLITELNKIASNKIEYWDIRCGVKNGTNLDFTEKKSKEISSYETLDCGIRTFINGGWGFVVLNEVTKNTIKDGFNKSIKLAHFSESFCKNNFKIKEMNPLIKSYKIDSKYNLESIDIKDKLELVKCNDDTACEYSNKITNVHTIYGDAHIYNLFLNSFGSYIYQEFSLLRVYCAIYAKSNGLLQRAVNSVGGLGGFEILKTDYAQNLSLKSAKEAVDLLKAKSPVGGKFTVIMDPKLTGTFVHEAFGHACEADLVLNKESLLEGKLGEIVAIEDVNIVDDPTIGQGKIYNLPYELYGSYFIDDEGIPSQKTMIIENGIFKNYLHNLETSSRMGVPPNGHGRAAGNSSIPQVRMGITKLEPKDWSLEEMIKDTKRGVLCQDFQYGYTDPTTGNFQFKCKLSYKIENGEKKELLRDVALSGMTLEVLNRITAIGKDISYSDGNCGKGGQSVRVSDGGPYIRVKEITVGGLN
ncbi:MAG: TldD/PmbA family protein [Promethearchaeota archaeon]